MNALAERAAAIAAKARVEIVGTREQNRERMPETAKLLDDMRLHFGKPAYFKLTENGITVEWLNPDYVRRTNGTLEYIGEPLT